jgi:cell division inhibitor SulA/protein ImuA
MSALAEVLVRPDIWRGDRLAQAPLPTVSSGFAALDAELPGGGWPRGALTELLVDGAGIGELSLLIPALRLLRGEGGWSLLVAPPHELHAPAWAAAGVDLARLAVVSPASPRDALWAMEQALASGAPRAVVGWVPSGQDAAARAVRRLQVAAAGSGALAFLFRPTRMADEASAAPLRLKLSSEGAGEGGRLSIRILKRRGPPLSVPLSLAVSRPPRHACAPRRHEPALAGRPAQRQFAHA